MKNDKENVDFVFNKLKLYFKCFHCGFNFIEREIIHKEEDSLLSLRGILFWLTLVTYYLLFYAIKDMR